MPKGAPKGCSRRQIRLHWAVVALIVLQVPSGKAVSHAMGRAMRDDAATILSHAVAVLRPNHP